MEHSVIRINRKLRTERKQQGLSQNKLADALGVTSRTVMRWEQGRTLPQPKHLRMLGTLLGKTAEELGLSWKADRNEKREQALPPVTQCALPEVTVPTPWLIDPTIQQPMGISRSMLKRDGLFTQIKEYLLGGENLAFTVLSGLSGIGKTSLAVQLATDQEVRLHFRDGILWAPLGPQADVLGQLMRWGAQLGVASSDVENSRSCGAWNHALRSAVGTRQMLFVIDDVWRAEDIQTLQIGGAQCSTLLTTSQPLDTFTGVQFCSITVPQLEEADGLVLLNHYVPQLVQQDPQRALALVQTVEGSPLAMTLMGNALAATTSSGQPWLLEATLAQLHHIEKRLRLRMVSASKEDWPSLAERVPLSLYAVIAICDQQLSPQAHASLCALAVFPPKPNCFSEEAALIMSRQPKEALKELWNAGLLEPWGPMHYTLHQTVVDYVRTSTKSLWNNSDRSIRGGDR